ncbi:hypothetical protein AGOR_G00222520 [Albula goreensis]|uniref:ZP domain-containing protein n=1 Tax=Albula goreensis TaxID=1534307 RepID=A0A8T3CKM9_9TELE|nr:hypothetical protein AGOR_G00222520 [Albula goreensis]
MFDCCCSPSPVADRTWLSSTKLGLRSEFLCVRSSRIRNIRQMCFRRSVSSRSFCLALLWFVGVCESEGERRGGGVPMLKYREGYTSLAECSCMPKAERGATLSCDADKLTQPRAEEPVPHETAPNSVRNWTRLPPPTSPTGLTLLCLLLFGAGTSAECVAGAQCPVCPVGALHPVQGFLEHFGAGPGCAAREGGEKETHVISVGKASPGSQKQVRVTLRPLSFSSPPRRSLILVLSSQRPVHWILESQNLPPGLPIVAQVALPSTVQARGVELQVEQVEELPWKPRVLLRWSLDRHASISSLTHAPLANRVYIRLGEDPTMPSACQLQPLFLSHNYLTSDLQPQEVRGCRPPGRVDALEVHVIRLRSAGSGICGSLQVEVPISVLPPVAGAGWYRVVLILSSTVPVNWALTATGIRGQITVYSTNSVSPLYPPEPDLTLTSILSTDLRTTHDLLGWANRNGFPKVTSYTDADLANRFVIRLAARGGTDSVGPRSLAALPRGPPVGLQERGLRDLLRSGGGMAGGGMTGGGQEPIAVQCQDGQLSVAVDTSILQSLLPPVTAVTLRDRGCEAHSNGSHFLLVFPVIACGTEGAMEAEPRGVRYKNTVLLWRSRTPVSVQNETEGRRADRQTPLVIHFSCFVAVPIPPDAEKDPPSPRAAMAAWAQQGAREPGYRGQPGGLVFTLQLFVTEGFEKRESGPCIIVADNCVYVEVSVKGAVRGGVEVQSCVVSPLSDPQASPGWPVIQDGCIVEPTFTLSLGGRGGESEGARLSQRERGRNGAEDELESEGIEEEEKTQRKGDGERRLSPSEPITGQLPGRPRLPLLIDQPLGQQCQYRSLLRPVLVTQPLGLSRRVAPPAGQRALKPSVTPRSRPSSADHINEVDTGSVVGISFAAFLIGVTLMGALWCIYTRTGVTLPHRRGSLLENVDQTTASWTPPPLLEQSNSSM